ncbi:DNA topoisomerase 2 [Phanerochaete sordida]|uniref:DNA topoisomerase 2 n=1 Tax=Phanerochaete sordida TaxID=48140 RepID=A0A9P3GFX2_9APHY|nr:DNA topoisomerase 2 [Phanerochaete sordida]
MSSSEENFDLDVSGSESDDYAPTTKKTTKAAPKPKATTKAAAKPAAKSKTTAAAKKKVLADKDDNASEDEMDEDEDDAGPSEKPAAPAKKKTASETYQKLTQLEHILKRPDSYIGSVEKITQPMWVWDSENKRMVNREITYVPGFFKIVDEILVNAADNKVNDPNMDTVKVTVDPENNTISVFNNGRGIPIEMHSTEKVYIPELIFGHLLSSSNYDDDEKKLTGGRNGYGAKLANIYSTEFTIDTADKNSAQRYVQTWTDNMGKMGKAKITKNSKKDEYTRVTFKPDLKRFGMDSIDEDAVALLKKRVYDLAGTTKDVKVFLNDERIKIKGFKQYVELYLNSVAEQAAEESGGAAQVKPSMIYEAVGKRWEVAFAVSDGTFQHVAFANSIATTKGGTHVNCIADQIAKTVAASIQKKNKGAAVKPAHIKSHMWIFINALIENPTFDSQTKEQLTLPASKFGTRPTLSEDFMKKVQKSSIIDQILNWASRKADKELKKTDGKGRNRLKGLPKLSDANNAGTRNAANCTLILTEGDSAKSLAVAGLSVIGRDNYGVFPLRGKLLNVREAKHDQIMKNEEIQNIKKILGLQHNKDYKDTNDLRYGQLMIMTDQDHDGSHIKGLILNYLDHFYPSLLKVPKFLVEFVTPIVRVTKGNQKINFFTIPEYEQWLENTPDSHKWKSKYYKGLGTSKDEDARDYFSQMNKHMIPFATVKDGERDLIDLAFSKKKADDRKEWLRNLEPGTFLNHDTREISVSDFINRELILFSYADNVRSIPSVADGLKPGQRKVIWGCFKRKLKSEIKVAQLVGYISEKAAYHHGEQSLMMTIVNLAQDFIGSNNVNLLMPNGQFGTRDQGGKDHASARYIFTELSPMSRALFHPGDDPLLNYLKDDTTDIEPEWYMPILPLVLVNGAEGIGTGWSTNVPCYNPTDIVANIRRRMNDEEMVPMLPWWRGFKGTIRKTGDHKYDVTGIVNKIDDTTVEITELPIHKWTQNYKLELEAMMGEKGDGPVKDYKEYHDNMNVHFVVTLDEKSMQKAESQGFLEFFKLTGKINTSNMMCFDFDGKIKKYNSPEEMIEDFYPVRLAWYQKRKDHMAEQLQLEFERLTNQARFISMIVSKELVVSGRKRTEVINDLRKKEFRPFPKIAKAKAAGETEEVVENADEEEDDAKDGSHDYDYLLNMAIYSLTKERIDKLKKQAADKEAELLKLLELTPIQMWNTDLDNFLEQWKLDYETWISKAIEPGQVAKKSKRKQPTLAAMMKKAAKKEAGDDDGDDDFKPTKAGASKARKVSDSKTAKKPSPPVKAEVKDEDSEDDYVKPAKKAPAKKAPAKKPKSEDEDSDAYVKPAPKKAPAKKAPAKIESDSEIEVVEKKKPTPPLKRKKPALPDDPDSDVAVVPSKGKGKAKAAPAATAAAKRKSPGSDVESDDEVALKPAKKKVATEKPLTDFFGKAQPKPAPTARKVSGSSSNASKGKAPVKKAAKKVVDSEDEDISMDELPPAPKRNEAPKRAARAAPKTYIDISDDGDGGSGSEFEDFD